MNIHKLNAKPKTIPPKTIQWRLLREVKYPARKVNSMTWEKDSDRNGRNTHRKREARSTRVLSEVG